MRAIGPEPGFTSDIRIFRFRKGSETGLGVEFGNEIFQLIVDEGLPPVTIATWLAEGDPVSWLVEKIESSAVPLEVIDIEMLPPIDRQEVWASGVTYLRSKVARMEESEDGGDFYDKVYGADRPELFFKSTAGRVVGPDRPIRIRRDSEWNVPEPELVLVISAAGNIVGYTIGNDVSSRSIEGENPLYLPQAKVYDGSCAIGPSILLKTGGEPVTRSIGMSISRDGENVFEGQVSTERIRRTEEELAEYLFREMTFEHGAFLLTGTGIVPPDNFTLRSGDIVRITIEGIGSLENPVE
jgi:2-dehydro-3-deoxy-D-arabinonate dehydratase